MVAEPDTGIITAAGLTNATGQGSGDAAAGVLSCGHSSLTLYIQLYLSGYELELKDLEAPRTCRRGR